MEKRDFEFKENDFELVQVDTQIKDKKLETKPTTFLKDAFRRFYKNKASVSAAFILGILLLLAIIVPITTTHNIDPHNPSTPEKFLAPKLFKINKNHFWDGTEKYENVVYDVVTECPAGYNKRAVLDCNIHPMQYMNQANEYGHNGYIMFASDRMNVASKEVFFLQSQEYAFTSNGEYSVKISLLNEEDVLLSKLGEYRILLYHVDSATNETSELVLKDWSKDYSEFTLDISNLLTDAGKTSFTGHFRFELKSNDNYYTYILIKSIEFSCKESMPNYNNLCVESEVVDDITKEVSKVYCTTFTDATQCVVIKDSNSDGYWICDGRKGIYKSEIYYCDFYYDTYENVYGADVLTYDGPKVTELVKEGIFEYSYNRSTGEFTWKILDPERCPFDDVIDYRIITRSGKLESLKVEIEKWKKMGYSSMPTYILGTEYSGYDLFAYSFAGLRTSLILGLCTAAFCFTFGLIWGAISGYFGGNVDIFMERFCEILSGVPWIVVMTLCILHLGKTFFTFFLALCLTGWMGTAGRTRAQFYRFKGREYVLASRTLGAGDFRLIFKHILPNSMGTIITGAVLMIPSVIFSEATISYLNLGLQDKQSFGVMMSNNQPFLENHPYVVIFPAIVMALMMISFNLFGNGLRDAFNPSLKGSD